MRTEWNVLNFSHLNIHVSVAMATDSLTLITITDHMTYRPHGRSGKIPANYEHILFEYFEGIACTKQFFFIQFFSVYSLQWIQRTRDKMLWQDFLKTRKSSCSRMLIQLIQQAEADKENEKDWTRTKVLLSVKVIICKNIYHFNTYKRFQQL